MTLRSTVCVKFFRAAKLRCSPRERNNFPTSVLELEMEEKLSIMFFIPLFQVNSIHGVT